MVWLTKDHLDNKITHVFTNVVDRNMSIRSYAEGITLEYKGNPYNLIFAGEQRNLTDDEVI